MKVFITGHEGDNETEIIEHIASTGSDQPGREVIRRVWTHFEIVRPHGQHRCMTMQPMRCQIDWLRLFFKQQQFPIQLLKIYATPILQGLDHLHRECHVIHCDLKMDNIMISFQQGHEQQILYTCEQAERIDPLPQKRLPDRTIYLPHNNLVPFNVLRDLGVPMLTDFDAALRDDTGNVYIHDIGANGLQAPEVVLGMPWTYSADVFMLAVCFGQLLQGRSPFDYRQDHGTHILDPAHYMARIISFLRPPPADFVKARTRNIELFDDEGVFTRPELLDTRLSFDSFFSAVPEDDERQVLIVFLLRALKWRPEERATAQELLNDPFLVHDCDKA